MQNEIDAVVQNGGTGSSTISGITLTNAGTIICQTGTVDLNVTGWNTAAAQLLLTGGTVHIFDVNDRDLGRPKPAMVTILLGARCRSRRATNWSYSTEPASEDLQLRLCPASRVSANSGGWKRRLRSREVSVTIYA